VTGVGATAHGPVVRTAAAPGRVNIIGDHTDYNGGVALPAAVDLTTIVAYTGSDRDVFELHTSVDPEPAEIPVGIAFRPEEIDELAPPWARMAGAVLAQCDPRHGGTLRITSGIPVGAGLSSSAAFCIALAFALGIEGTPEALARLCQRAEAAVHSEVGLMDPLVCVLGQAGHALLIDFSDLQYAAVPVPPTADLVVIHSGVDRILARTPYAARRGECEAATIELGVPLGRAELADVAGILDPILRRRTRHVVTECARVHACADALVAGDLDLAGRIMTESHRSIAGDFDASPPVVDDLVDRLVATPGVHGARQTGGGFGGCVVALADAGAIEPEHWSPRAWRVRPSSGATVTETGAAGPGPGLFHPPR
jgi:galactokinase